MTQYTNEQRIEALAALQANGGNLRRTAEAIGIPHPTLFSWRERALHSESMDEAGNVRPDAVIVAEREKNVLDHADAWGTASNLAAGLIRENLTRYAGQELTPRDLQSVAIVGGISRDAHLDYRDGRKGATVNVDARSVTLPAGLSVDELRSLALGPALEGPQKPS